MSIKKCEYCEGEVTHFFKLCDICEMGYNMKERPKKPKKVRSFEAQLRTAIGYMVFMENKFIYDQADYDFRNL